MPEDYVHHSFSLQGQVFDQSVLVTFGFALVSLLL